MKIGGPIAVIAGGMFFLLRHYVTAHIKADFDEKLETVRLRNKEELEKIKQQNQAEIERLRGGIQADVEMIKTTLEVSSSATRLLIKKRVDCYEDFFRAQHVLDDALSGIRSVFHQDSPAAFAAHRDDYQLKYYTALEGFNAVAARLKVFVNPAVEDGISALLIKKGQLGQSVIEGHSGVVDEQVNAMLKLQVQVAAAIRDDLRQIQKTGKMDFVEPIQYQPVGDDQLPP